MSWWWQKRNPTAVGAALGEANLHSAEYLSGDWRQSRHCVGKAVSHPSENLVSSCLPSANILCALSVP